MKTKAFRFFIYGLLADAILVLVVAALDLSSVIAQYNGKCGGGLIFGGSPHPCSLFEFVREIWPWSLLIVVIYWWVFVIVLSLPPAIGLLIGLRKKVPA